MSAPNYRHYIKVSEPRAENITSHVDPWKPCQRPVPWGVPRLGRWVCSKTESIPELNCWIFFWKKETCLRYFWWKLFILRYRIRTNLKFLNMSENPFLRMNKVPYLNFVVSTNTNHAQSCPLPFSHKRVALFFDTNAEACSGKGASVISFSSPWLEVDIW